MHCPEDYSSEAEKPCCCCHLSPPPPPHLDVHSYLAALEDVITPYLTSNLCLLGDFNAKQSAWFCDQITDCPGRALKEFADNFDLKQIIGEPTYNVTTDHPSLLDLVFTNRPQCRRAQQTDNGRVGWYHQIHTSRLPRMIRNHMYTRLYQAPCQLCLTTSLLATDGISHEGPRFFTLVQP